MNHLKRAEFLNEKNYPDPPETPNFLSTLPVELIVVIFRKLDYVSLYYASKSYAQWASVMKTSPYLDGRLQRYHQFRKDSRYIHNQYTMNENIERMKEEIKEEDPSMGVAETPGIAGPSTLVGISRNIGPKAGTSSSGNECTAHRPISRKRTGNDAPGFGMLRKAHQIIIFRRAETMYDEIFNEISRF